MTESIKSNIKSSTVLHLVNLPFLILLIPHDNLQLLPVDPRLQQMRGLVGQRLSVFAHILRYGDSSHFVHRLALVGAVEVYGLGQRGSVNHHCPGLQALRCLPPLD